MNSVLVRSMALGLMAAFFVSCGDGGDGSTPTPQPTPQVYPQFAYVANADENIVSTYWLDATAGRLKLTSTVSAGATPCSVTVDPSGRFAYAANELSNTISVYAIDRATGALTPGTPAAVGANPYSVTTTGAIQ